MRSGKAGFSVLWALALLATDAVAADPLAGRTWRTVAELTAAEREVIDLRTDTPRSAEDAARPAEPFPFEAPYTAEEIGYRLMNFSHVASWSHVMVDVFGVITKTGYLTQNIMVGLVNQTASEHGPTGQLDAKPGDPYSLQLYYYTYPPKDNGVQQMWVMRRTGLEHPTKMDLFVYSPALRRVRRQPPPRRDAQFPDNVPSLDDIFGREAWEYSWRFVGTDVITETVRFPKTRTRITLAKPDGTFYEKATADFKIMGDAYPYYRADGGVDCFVVVAEPDRKWLPDYDAGKVIYWVDQHYFYPLRMEQYDKQGQLKTMQVRFAERENEGLKDGEGYTNPQTVYYDLKLDLISYSVHDANGPHTWEGKEQEYFTPDFMRRRWLTHLRKSQALVDSPEEFYLRPSLLAERFPDERSITVAPDVAARIAAQDAAGQLVFTAGDAAGTEAATASE